MYSHSVHKRTLNHLAKLAKHFSREITNTQFDVRNSIVSHNLSHFF